MLQIVVLFGTFLHFLCLFAGFHCFHFPITKNWLLSFKPEPKSILPQIQGLTLLTPSPVSLYDRKVLIVCFSSGWKFLEQVHFTDNFCKLQILFRQFFKNSNLKFKTIIMYNTNLNTSVCPKKSVQPNKKCPPFFQDF